MYSTNTKKVLNEFSTPLTLLSLIAHSQLGHITYISFCVGAMGFVYLAILINTNPMRSLQRGCIMTMAPAQGSDCASLLSDAQLKPCVGAMGFVYIAIQLNTNTLKFLQRGCKKVAAGHKVRRPKCKGQRYTLSIIHNPHCAMCD